MLFFHDLFKENQNYYVIPEVLVGRQYRIKQNKIIIHLVTMVSIY